MSCDGAVPKVGTAYTGQVLPLACCEADHVAAATARRRRRRELAPYPFVLVAGIGAPGSGTSGGLGGFNFFFGGGGVIPPIGGPNTKTGVPSSSGGGPVVEH